MRNGGSIMRTFSQRLPLQPEKMSVSGALFDLDKLNDVSKNVISAMNAQTVLNEILHWAEQYDQAFFARLNRDREYAQGIFCY